MCVCVCVCVSVWWWWWSGAGVRDPLSPQTNGSLQHGPNKHKDYMSIVRVFVFRGLASNTTTERGDPLKLESVTLPVNQKFEPLRK